MQAAAAKERYWAARDRLSSALAKAARVCDDGEIAYLYRSTADQLDDLAERIGSEPL
jgi:hypothetical protein